MHVPKKISIRGWKIVLNQGIGKNKIVIPSKEGIHLFLINVDFGVVGLAGWTSSRL